MNYLSNYKTSQLFDNDLEIVLSSTVSLSRNVAGYKFVPKASENEFESIMEMFGSKFLIDFQDQFDHISYQPEDPFESDVLAEEQVTSVGFAEKTHPRGVFLAKSGGLMAVVNDLNHLKIRQKALALDLEYCWQRLNELDDKIEQDIEYAFSPQFGYLTTSPQDAGTGLRVSVQMHLPSIAMQGRVGDLYDYAQAKDLDISGCRGDCDPEGDMFCISNIITIGKTEEQIIDDFQKAVIKIAEYEIQMRMELKKDQPDLLQDSTNRAYGTLAYAHMINYIEAANLLSKVRLGILTGVIEYLGIREIDDLLKKITPAMINYKYCEQLDYDKQDKIRAEMIKEIL